MGTKTFNFTGAVQSWVVPANVFEIDAKLYGAAGGGARGGKGAHVRAKMNVTPGETLRFYVGGAGKTAAAGIVPAGGWNGGGNGGKNSGGGIGGMGSGGGASDVRQGGTTLATRKLVAAGGGGQAPDDRTGGRGGAATGESGQPKDFDWQGTPGGGGTQTAGGTGYLAGSAGQGGAGENSTADYERGGGGGGGGFYGGGGGGMAWDAHGGAGGGGSNYVGGATTVVTDMRGGRSGDGVITIDWNSKPNDPAIKGPKNNAVLVRTQSQRFSWEFSDNDVGDSQSAYQLRYRVVAVTANPWTTLAATDSVNSHHDFAGGFFTNGDYEWQVRTADAQGLWSDYSASAFYTIADPPNGPTITEPINGGVIGSNSEVVRWSSSEQESYQIRRASPDLLTIHYDSGEVLSGTIREHSLDFPTNNQDESIQVRVKRQTLWSEWSTVNVTVSYTPPAVPVLTVTPENDRGRNLVEVTNPTPGTGEPSVIHNILQRRLAGAVDWLDIGVLGANGSYYDHHIGSDIMYEYRVVAQGSNSTSSSSAVVTATLRLTRSWLFSVDDPAGTLKQFRFNNEGGSEGWNADVTLSQYAGRKHPVAEFGEHETESASVTIDLDGRDEIDYVREVARSKSVFCYRDASGRKVYGVIPGYTLGSLFYGGRTSLTLEAVDYQEGEE